MVNIIQVFYYPMHGDSNWKYVIDVAPRAARVLQATQDLTSMDEVNRIVDAVEDHQGSTDDAKAFNYSSTLTDGSSTSDSDSESRLMDTFELDTNADDIDTVSHSTIGVNLEMFLEIDHDDLYADITSVP